MMPSTVMLLLFSSLELVTLTLVDSPLSRLLVPISVSTTVKMLSLKKSTSTLSLMMKKKMLTTPMLLMSLTQPALSSNTALSSTAMTVLLSMVLIQ